MTTILAVNSSGRYEGSYSRTLVRELIEKLQANEPDATIVHRDVAHGVEFVDQTWIASNFTPLDDRDDAQRARLQNSDQLVEEVKNADHIIIAAPIYNFGVPAALKAWIDQICRAGVTFRYTPDGPQGLLSGKKAHIIVTSGGTEAGGDADFASDYLKFVMGFIGITDVQMVAADRLIADETAALSKAHTAIAEAA